MRTKTVRVSDKGQVAIPIEIRRAMGLKKGSELLILFDGEKIHRREISVGVSSATKYEVVTGLKDGDRIALPGDQDLRDGMDVRAAEGK